MNNNKYFHIDVLKLVLAVAVVMIHTQPLLDVPNTNYYICEGLCKAAVPIFFCLSGFFYAYKGRKWKHLTKRVLLLYIIWNILYLPISIRHFAGFDLRQVVFCGTFAVSWYLVALVWCAAIEKMCSKIKWYLPLCLGALLYFMAVADGGWANLFSDTFVSDMRMGWKLLFEGVSFSFPHGLLFFSIGAFVYGKDISTKTGYTVLFAGIILLFCELYFIELHKYSLHTDTLFSFVMIVAGVGILVCKPHECQNVKISCRGGAIS